MGRTLEQERILCGRVFGCHTENNGGSSKGPDDKAIPLGERHHAEMDGRLSTAITTKAQFAAKYGLDLAKEAAAHYQVFLIWKEAQS